SSTSAVDLCSSSRVIMGLLLDPLMGILKEHIGHMAKDQLTSHQSELTYFLISLDFRAQHCQGDLEKTREMERNLIDCLLAFVIKLSEVSFRPLFFKVFDWVMTESAAKDHLAKGLSILFAGHLVKPFSDLLRQTNITKTDEAFFDTEDNIEKSCPLLEYILDCLHKICLMTLLVDQVEKRFTIPVTKHLALCTLNYKILLKSQHSSAKVRYLGDENALRIALYECEKVEHQVQKIIHKMENILGEPLLSYL
uniref:HEAT repeat-containing protein 1 n=1 Tax=Oncorhynchus kisutch TaxID=8019 RepID=A0A8C7MUJ0_ONCKI